MIGVIAEGTEREIAAEFFELFKTPWEFWRPDRKYDVLLCSSSSRLLDSAKLVVIYGGRRSSADDAAHRSVACESKKGGVLHYQGRRIPIYGCLLTFSRTSGALLLHEETQQCADVHECLAETATVRIGYDLFAEVRTLLEKGQPALNASTPALDLHIAVLRDLIIGCGLGLVEIPPAPEGYRFIACLTHDVDHPSIRRHRWDHTTFGFLYRATAGSLRDFLRRKIGLSSLIANLLAAFRLPLVQFGLSRDFWNDFDERYLEIEGALPSTFFIIPFADRSGAKSNHGPAPKFRAAKYGAKDIADKIQNLSSAGREIGLHGIDAWMDSSKGREELDEIRHVAGESSPGVRMHWLYYGDQSPQVLEKAGAAYDSTVGYNNTIGFRAGTAQAYRPLKTQRLLELPLHAMDTALFYPSYLALSARDAAKRIAGMADYAAEFGGCLTLNWHDRSLAPERLWGDCYREVIRDLESRDVWFATASQAVAWFRKRRAAVFEEDAQGRASFVVKSANCKDTTPNLRLRIYEAKAPNIPGGSADLVIDAAAGAAVAAGTVSEFHAI